MLTRSPWVDLTKKGCQTADKTELKHLPLIKSGIEPPVKNPTRSLVNELQLKSIEWFYMRFLLCTAAQICHT